MSGGLYDPLGTDRAAQAPRRRPSVALVTVGTIAAAAALLGVVVVLRGGGERGEPSAVVTIERSPSPALPPPPPVATVPVAPPSAPVAPVPPAVSAASGDADVEIQNGVRIIRMRPQSTKPSAQGATLSTTPATDSSPSQGTQIPRTH